MAAAKHIPLDDRFWSKVSKLPDEPGCWLWTAALHTQGYGAFNVGGQNLGAHRLAYIDQRGQVPDGLELDHLCRVRSCVNPWHLEAVTSEENWRRGVSRSAENARKSRCPRGHDYEPVGSRPGRFCRTCQTQTNRRNWLKTRAARKAALTPRACVYCGGEFKPTRQDARYCGQKCRMGRFLEARAAARRTEA